MTETQNPQVAIIILHWNRYQETRDCLDSLRQVTYSPFNIILVDNGSTDGSPQRLAEEFPDIHVIYNHANLGFSKGNNVGIRYALEQGADYVMLLNNDTIVSPTFLDLLVEVGELDETAGAVSGTIYDLLDGVKTRTIFYAGGKMSYLRGTGVTFRFNQIDDLPNERTPEQVGFVSGCAVLLKSSVLKTIGLLDEDFFFGVEDADLSWRLTKAGYNMIYVPNAIIWHKKSSSRSFSMGEFYNAIVSKAILMQKYLPKSIFYFWWLGYSIKTTLMLPFLLKFLQKKHQLPAPSIKEIRKVILLSLYRGFSPTVKSGFDPKR